MKLQSRLLTENSTIQCPCYNTEIIIFYLISFTSSLGLLETLLTVSVFFSLTRAASNGHMFYYFLIKSLDDAVQFLTLLMAPIYLTSSRAGNLWYIWFYRYLKSAFELSSSLMQCAATFDCYLTVHYLTVHYNSRFKCCRTVVTGHLVAILIHLFAIGFNIFWIFSYEEKQCIQGSKNKVNKS